MSVKSLELLIIFVKNPEEGKVKTRLAATVGNAKALEIYLQLLEKTRKVTTNLNITKALYYSDHLENEDNWDKRKYVKSLQKGRDLGERMMNSFREGFARLYAPICIIGSDCYELTPEIILDAFDRLKKNDVVLGPSKDGGYYLIGMNKLNPEIFLNKSWSTDKVLSETLNTLKKLNLSVTLLKELNDVDTEDDLFTIYK